MGKLVCKCGNVIVAQTDYLPNKGSIIKEQDEEEFFDVICENIGEFLSFKSGGIDRKDWIIENLGEDYPIDLPMVNIIRDYITGIRGEYFKRLYECKKCGALLLQEKDDFTKFRCYQPV